MFFFSFYSLLVALPKFLDSHSDTVIGIVVGAFGLGSFAARLWAGVFTDAFGRRLMVIVGATGCSFALFAYAQGDFPPGLAGVRLLHGVAWVVFLTSWTTLCLALAPEGRRAEVMAATLTATHSAALYAPALALWLGPQIGYQALFVILGCACLAGGALTLIAPVESTERKPWRFPRRIPFSKPAITPLLGFLGTTIAFGSVQGFLVLRAEGHASPEFFLLSFGITVITVSIIASRLISRLDLWVTAGVGLLFVAASMVIVAISAEPLALVVAGGLFAAGFGASYTGMTTIAAESAPAAERGLAVATVTMAFDFGTAAPFVLGVLSDAAGVASVFVFAAGVALASLVWVATKSRAEVSETVAA